MDAVWIKTREMAEALGCHRNTLSRLKQSGFFREGQHYRKVNPLSSRGDFTWHSQKVMLKMGSIG